MPIDVTPGSATAVAYGSEIEADAYFLARGISAWTGTGKEAALTRGADYLERTYAGQWIGLRTNDEQSMAWPRVSAVDLDGYPYDADEIPRGVKNANFEAALLVLSGVDLEPTLERGGAIKRTRAKAGPAEAETEFTSGASAYDTYAAVEGSLRGLITAAGELVRV